MTGRLGWSRRRPMHPRRTPRIPTDPAVRSARPAAWGKWSNSAPSVAVGPRKRPAHRSVRAVPAPECAPPATSTVPRTRRPRSAVRKDSGCPERRASSSARAKETAPAPASPARSAAAPATCWYLRPATRAGNGPPRRLARTSAPAVPARDRACPARSAAVVTSPRHAARWERGSRARGASSFALARATAAASASPGQADARRCKRRNAPPMDAGRTTAQPVSSSAAMAPAPVIAAPALAAVATGTRRHAARLVFGRSASVATSSARARVRAAGSAGRGLGSARV